MISDVENRDFAVESTADFSDVPKFARTGSLRCVSPHMLATL